MLLRMRAGLVLLAAAGVALGQQAEKHVVVVAGDGSGAFTTVQAALDSAGEGGLILRLKPGTYREKLTVRGNGIEMRGMGKTPGEVKLSWNDSAKSAGGTSKSASVTVTGDNFVAENLTIENTFELEKGRTEQGSQAVALLVSGDREVFRNVRLLGYQDTLYANSKTCHAKEEVEAGKPCQASRQYFEHCYIEGHVDFIFGDAAAWFEDCELHAMAHQVVMLTAQSRLFAGEQSGYVFDRCRVTADKDVGSIFFGRPWRGYSTVTFLNTDVQTTHLNPAGWSEWDGRLATSSYSEFGTHGVGAGKVQGRVAGSKQLSAEEAGKLSVKAFLGGNDGWNPAGVR